MNDTLRRDAKERRVACDSWLLALGWCLWPDAFARCCCFSLVVGWMMPSMLRSLLLTLHRSLWKSLKMRRGRTLSVCVCVWCDVVPKSDRTNMCGVCGEIEWEMWRRRWTLELRQDARRRRQHVCNQIRVGLLDNVMLLKPVRLEECWFNKKKITIQFLSNIIYK